METTNSTQYTIYHYSTHVWNRVLCLEAIWVEEFNILSSQLWLIKIPSLLETNKTLPQDRSQTINTMSAMTSSVGAGHSYTVYKI